MSRAIWGHAVVLGVASLLALRTWTEEEEPAEAESVEVQVWGGKPDQIQKISFKDEQRSVNLEPKKDALGSWFVGTVVKQPPKAPPPSDPRERDPRMPPMAAPDAGAPAAPPPVPRVPETSRFVAVTAANKLADKLAPLRALRAVGKIDKKREEEFGFDKPQGTLRITIAGTEQTLTIGGSTPGGSDRYVRVKNGEVFAIPGDIFQDLSYADSRLLEREFHEFKPEDVVRVKITKGTKKREILRLEDKKDGWADVSAPLKLDETAGNWMSKLGRIKVMKYLEKPAQNVGPDDLIVRVDYFDAKKTLGTFELVKLKNGPDTEYLVKSELSRWYVTVLKSNAEQVEQDLDSLLK